MYKQLLARKGGKDYWIPIIVLLRVNAGACGAVGRHCLVSIFAKVKYILLFIVMHTFDDFRSDKGALCDDAF